MANGPLLTKQTAAIYGAILLIGGGGGVVGVKSADGVERRVDDLETTQAVILEKVKNIEENQDRIEDDSKERHEDVMEAIEALDR